MYNSESVLENETYKLLSSGKPSTNADVKNSQFRECIIFFICTFFKIDKVIIMILFTKYEIKDLNKDLNIKRFE